jgi:hypothetical protein
MIGTVGVGGSRIGVDSIGVSNMVLNR